jgi:ABC-type dipeptide/oligopeptide/nickel transport system permease component
MLRYVLRRLMWMVPTVLVVTFIAFWAVRSGTNPVQSFLRSNPRATPAQVAKYKQVNGLVGSTPEQYVRWLGHFVTGNWGRSIKGSRPVWPALKDSLANSLTLGAFATVIGISVGLGIGILSALRQYSKFDTIATTGAFVGISVPPFVSAILIQTFIAVFLKNWLHLSKPLLPTSGVYPPGHEGFNLILRIKYMILPAFVVAIQIIAQYSRYMRASLLEVINSDYMRTARAKGISERRVIVRHALRNALIPVVTVAAIDIGAIVGGLIITERIFEYPGMGLFLITALGNGDFPQLMPWLVIIVMSTIVFNLLADVAYAWLDPRIRLD